MVESIDKRSGWISNRLRIVLWGSIVLILLIPLVTMQFTDEVNWNFMDFMVAGGILSLAALAFEQAFTKLNKPKTRFAVGITIISAVLIIWIELAVGLF